MKKTVFTLTTLILLGGNALIANPVFAQASHAGHGADHSMNHGKSDQKSEIYTTRGRIEGIDKTISQLEKTKQALLSSENNLRLANDKAQDLTIIKCKGVFEKKAIA